MAKSDKRGPATKRRSPKAPKKPRSSQGKAAAAPRGSGARGTAPWVARHADKHAEEVRRRNADPIPPGSARATLRVPKEADQIKQRIGELHAAMNQIRALKKRAPENYYAIGALLGRIRHEELYTAKGFTSFETFVERELDFGKGTALALERIPQVFTESAAKKYELAPLMAALSALEETPSGRSSGTAPGLPLKPPTRKRH